MRLCVRGNKPVIYVDGTAAGMCPRWEFSGDLWDSGAGHETGELKNTLWPVCRGDSTRTLHGGWPR